MTERPPPGSGGAERRLGLLTATMLVVASMVGTGVFTTTGLLVRDIGSPAAVLTSWAVGGLAALCGALAYAELVAALPRNGGEYQLLSRIYHPGLGFVSGFTSLVVGFSAPIAASAIAFSDYLSRVLPGSVLDSVLYEAPELGIRVQPTPIALIVLLSALHALRVTLGGRVQDVLTVAKTGLIVALIAVGAPLGDPDYLASGADRGLGGALLSPAFAVGLIYVSFSYTGWNAATYVAGEVRDPRRTLPLALLTGTLLVTALYLGLNYVFLVGAPASALSGEVEVGHVAFSALFGAKAGRLLSAVIALGLLSTVGALIMTGARVYETMGEDYPRLRRLSRRGGNAGPARAIALQAGVALVMVVTASFDELLTYIGFTLSLFGALTVAGVFVLRKREPHLERPYRTWGYPVTPVVFIALMLWMIAHTIGQRPVVTFVGLGTLALGYGLYLGLRPRQSPGSRP